MKHGRMHLSDLVRNITMVRNMVKKVSHYGPIDVLITLTLRGSDAPMVRSTLPVRSNTVQLLPQPSRSSQPSLIASAYQPQRRELEQRSDNEPPVTLLPQKPRACRSCGHMGHEVVDCPVLQMPTMTYTLIGYTQHWVSYGQPKATTNMTPIQNFRVIRFVTSPISRRSS